MDSEQADKLYYYEHIFYFFDFFQQIRNLL